MKKLCILDSHDYSDAMPVYEKHTVRGIILDEGRVAMQMSDKGIYKIPGGCVDPDETLMDALVREVREELGLIVDESSVQELGEIEEIREDHFQPGQIYVCHSFFYLCQIRPGHTETEMTESEIEKGYRLAWATFAEIYAANRHLLDNPWTRRDTEFIRMVLEGGVRLERTPVPV